MNMLVMLGYTALFPMDMIQEMMITMLPKIVMEDILWLEHNTEDLNLKT